MKRSQKKIYEKEMGVRNLWTILNTIGNNFSKQYIKNSQRSMTNPKNKLYKLYKKSMKIFQKIYEEEKNLRKILENSYEKIYEKHVRLSVEKKNIGNKGILDFWGNQDVRNRIRVNKNLSTNLSTKSMKKAFKKSLKKIYKFFLQKC